MDEKSLEDGIGYVREIESYLCRKNGGHLIRIVGPAFEMVRGWAEQGVPLKVAFRGIDRRCDRNMPGSKRLRPLRIEFCEADVLAEFDDWRRAIGSSADRVAERGPAKASLASHIERTVTRLLAVPVNGHAEDLSEAIAAAVRALDEMVSIARQARGESRARLIARLAELDQTVITAARQHIDPDTATRLRQEASSEIAAFAARMPPGARERTQTLAFDRLLRESLSLPVIAYNG